MRYFVATVEATGTAAEMIAARFRDMDPVCVSGFVVLPFKDTSDAGGFDGIVTELMDFSAENPSMKLRVTISCNEALPVALEFHRGRVRRRGMNETIAKLYAGRGGETSSKTRE